MTTIAVQRYLDDLANLPGESPAEPLIRKLLARSVDRLHQVCARLLYSGYPRLMQGPLNLQSDELLSAVVERLIKALRKIRPRDVRQFFALAIQHMRWELNDIARRLDEQTQKVESLDLHENLVVPNVPTAGSNLQRILDAIDSLPKEEHEIFYLVRIQGMTQSEAAAVVGVSNRTVHRRMIRGLMHLEQMLGDLAKSQPVRFESPRLPI